MTKPRWVIQEQLQRDQPIITVRQLLQQQWLLPKRFVHYLRSRQQVTINGDYRHMNELVHPGDQVIMGFWGDEFRTAASHYLPTVGPQLDVLFENRDLLVVNKPAGQKTHPNQPLETGTLLNDVAGYLADTPSQAYMVHRLDQQTSGAVIVAKNPVVVPILDRLIAEGHIHRQYLAVVTGIFQRPRGTFDWPIGRDPQDQRKRMVNGAAAKEAHTAYEVLGTGAGQSIVSLTLQTGRTHQLRVHLAHSGHPIIGDPLYNPGTGDRLLLHGVQQQLILPFREKLRRISAPVPNYFPSVLLKYYQN
ncbi:RluA family pseudouridine synthase [Limosilactobacillus caecicola]|uniref:RluA family pseudouridine synthase n=1 Tax=Limosilactobacillus caecicola TaxID=2941332 RepID=UPI0020416026|nr:RluA family pseudouridine synthase [Limosilactobacillus caecicola]